LLEHDRIIRIAARTKSAGWIWWGSGLVSHTPVHRGRGRAGVGAHRVCRRSL